MLDFLNLRLITYKQCNPHELSLQQLKKLEREIKNRNGHQHDLPSDEYLDFLLWCNDLPSRQEIFANFISKRLSKHIGSKILEVGGGRTGRLSRFLNEKGFQMTCIDPLLEVTNSVQIEFIKKKFDYRTFDLAPYDYVIAQEPCDATEHIVRACIAQHKPFLISLCGVPHNLISGEKPKDLDEWYTYLLNIARGEMKLLNLSLDPFSRTPILRSNQF